MAQKSELFVQTPCAFCQNCAPFAKQHAPKKLLNLRALKSRLKILVKSTPGLSNNNESAHLSNSKPFETTVYTRE
jgi:hypothetical protein